MKRPLLVQALFSHQLLMLQLLFGPAKAHQLPHVRVTQTQQQQFVDCTLHGGPKVVHESTLRRASLGSLSDANIQLWHGMANSGSLVSPNAVMQGTLDMDLRFTILPSVSSSSSYSVQLFGYLVRIAAVQSGTGFEPYFVGDSRNVGIVSFCSALGLLVSNVSVVSFCTSSNETSVATSFLI